MNGVFSNMAFIWWFSSFTRVKENPLIKWWIENRMPHDFLAFLDNNPLLNGRQVTEKDILLAWMSIGLVHDHILSEEGFIESFIKNKEPVSRNRKTVGLILASILIMGGLIGFSLTEKEILIFPLIGQIVPALVLASFDYHRLYGRLIRGKFVPLGSCLKLKILTPVITVSFMFIIPAIISFSGIEPIYYIDISNYPLILKMLLETLSFVAIVLLWILIFEIYLRAALKLIEHKLLI
jgi:hypothetical protein